MTFSISGWTLPQVARAKSTPAAMAQSRVVDAVAHVERLARRDLQALKELAQRLGVGLVQHGVHAGDARVEIAVQPKGA